MKRRIILLILISALLLVGSVRAAPNALDISWQVIGAGGGHVEAGAFALDATIGQPVVGIVEGGSFNLCSGFWCRLMAISRNYLPVIRK